MIKEKFDVVKHSCLNEKDKFAFIEYIFESWDDLRTYLFSFSTDGSKKRYVFRGHANAAWKLQPTIDRLNVYDSVSVEDSAISRFKKDVAIFVKPNDISFLNSPQSDLEWLALMQHHGAATRLLDFSDSPFVAAFFAMANIATSDTERCIWAVPLKQIDERNVSASNERSRTFDKEYESLKIDKSGKSDILGYSYLNKQFERLFRQQGCFIYSLSGKDSFYSLLKKYFDDSSFNTAPLIKLTLRNKEKHEMAHAIDELKLMNISYSSLFPDLDGFSKDILLSELYSKK